MTLSAAISRLREFNEPVPKPMRLPTSQEVAEAEQILKYRFPDDYRTFLLQASDVVFGTKEPATVTRPDAHTHLLKICNDAWESYGVPRHLLPFCEDNADFYCLNPSGEVLFWSHNGWSGERWPNLETWINEVWIGESS